MTDSATPPETAIDTTTAIDTMAATARRRADRRAFFRAAVGTAAAGAALAWTSTAEAQTIGDADILNFALNLEYLEAQFYTYAVTGTGLAGGLLTGTGRQGLVTGGRQVDFSGDPIIGRMAAEIAADEAAHVAFLRQQLGNSAVAQPALDISASATGAFSKVAQAAKIVAAGAAFDPYASIDNFLLAAYIFEDVGVTAYKGAAPLITSKVYLEAAAGILAVEAYHAATLRTQLYNRGQVSGSNLITFAQGISDARDSLDGGTDLDQGITSGSVTQTNTDGTTTTLAVSNIVPGDGFAVAYSRGTGQVLNIAYITSAAATAGGFFPAGVNGTITTSTAQ